MLEVVAISFARGVYDVQAKRSYDVQIDQRQAGVDELALDTAPLLKMCTTTGLPVTTGSANFYIAATTLALQLTFLARDPRSPARATTPSLCTSYSLHCNIDHNSSIRSEHHVKHVHISSLNDVALEAGERSVGHLLMARCTLLGCADDEHFVCG